MGLKDMETELQIMFSNTHFLRWSYRTYGDSYKWFSFETLIVILVLMNEFPQTSNTEPSK